MYDLLSSALRYTAREVVALSISHQCNKKYVIYVDKKLLTLSTAIPR